MLSDKALRDFQGVWKKEFGQDIPYEEAEMQATSLLRLFNLIYKPIPKEWINEKSTKRERGEK